MISGFFEKIQTQNIIWALIVFFYASFFGAFVFFVHANAAEVHTVCDTGCDFTTIGAAITGSASTDTIRVIDTYSGTGEASTLTLHAAATLECIGGPVIGTAGATTTIVLAGDDTLQDCTLRRVEITTAAAASDISILNNIFDDSVYSTIDITGSENITVSGNANIPRVYFNNNGTVAPIITDNAFSPSTNGAISGSVIGSSITVTGNSFDSAIPLGLGTSMVSLVGSNVLFATNTVRLSGTQVVEAGPAVDIIAASSGSATGNFVSAVTDVPVGIRLSAGTNSTVLTASHNTVRHANSTGMNSSFGIIIASSNYNSVVANLYYNLIYNLQSESEAATSINAGSGSITLNNDYNAVWGPAYAFTSDELKCFGTVTGCTRGANWVSQINPHLRLWNGSSADDQYPAPYSIMFDVNGTEDIGAYKAARRSEVFINSLGIIDYSTIDTTSTDAILTSNARLRSGDTINFAAGTYDINSFSTTTVGSSLTIQGAGSSATILRPTSAGVTVTGLDGFSMSGVTVRGITSSHALVLDETSNSTISNVIFESASSTLATYLSSNMIYSFGGNDYDDGDSVGGTTNSMFVLSDTNCSAVPFDYDGGDISSYVDGSQNVHIALVSVGGSIRLTFLVPNDIATSAAQVEAQCSGNSVEVDVWSTDAFVASGGLYTYDSAGVPADGLTMKAGHTNPPYITKIGGYAGVKLLDASSNTFTNVTSTANTYAFFFQGTSASNIITDSVFSSSTAADILSLSSSGTNSLKNTEFNHASTTISTAATLTIYQKIAVTVRNALNDLIGGAVVNFNSANSSVTGTATTTDTGTSPYTTDLLSSVYTSATTAVTAGGYNPYTFSISATSTYAATTTAVNLSEPYQAITIYLAAAEEEEEETPAPTPPPGTNISQPQDPPPVITNFKINNGETVTPTTTVLISLAASNAIQMVVSADPSFQNTFGTPYQSSFSMSLSTTPGIKTLYARVYNSQGTASETSITSIEYNPTAPPIAPTGSVSIIGSIVDSMTSSTSVILLLAHDAQASEMMISDSSGFESATWQAVTSSVPWVLPAGDGIKHVYVKYKSAQNLESPSYTASVILDQTAPAKPSFIGAIENGQFTTSPTTIAGTSEPSVTVNVRLSRGNTTIFQKNVSANALGVWSASIDSSLQVGTYSVTAFASDAIGNSGAAAATTFVVSAQVIEEPDEEPEPQPEPPTPQPDNNPPPPSENQTPGTGEGSGDSGSSGGSSGGSDSSGGSTEEIPLEENVVPVEQTPTQTTLEKTTEEVVIAQEKIAETGKAAAASINKAAKKTAEVIKIVQSIPEVQVANQAIVVPAAAAIGIAAVSGAVNGAQALTYLQFLFTQPAFLLARRRRKGWGVVYNAITKMPADLATVRLVDSATGRVVQSRVTDQMGRYQFFAKPGAYSIDISKPNYQFPVSYLKDKKDDGKFLDLYTGGTINSVTAAALSYNAPLDPIGVDKPLDQLVRAERKKVFAALFGSIGLAVTAVSFVISPTPLVGGFLILHAVSHFMFRRIAMPKKPESWGVIADADGKPLEQAVVRVFDKQYNKLLDTQVTDDKGRYAFLVGKNDYYLMIEKPGFQKVVTDTISVPEAEGGSVLAANVRLQK